MLTFQTPREAALSLAERIRLLRLKKGFSQEEMAKRAGLKMSTYRYFEKTSQISLERLLRVAEALGRLGDLNLIFQPDTVPVPAIQEIIAATPKRGKTTRAK